MGIIEFEDLKAVLMKYGEQMDEDEMKLFEKSMNVSDGKIIVDGNFSFKKFIIIIFLGAGNRF